MGKRKPDIVENKSKTYLAVKMEIFKVGCIQS